MDAIASIMDEMAGDDERPPHCSVCNHDHEQGVKCTICGHTGKSRTFRILRNRPLGVVFSVRGYDCLESPTQALDPGLYGFTVILRQRIFPHDAAQLADDNRARHVIAFLGDAPIAVARWQLVTVADPGSNGSGSDAPVVRVNHVGVLPDKRQRGYGSQLMAGLVDDVNQRLTELQTPCRAILAMIPEQDNIASKLFTNAGFHVDSQWQSGSDYIPGTARMVLLPPET